MPEVLQQVALAGSPALPLPGPVIPQPAQWLAVHTRSRHEKQVERMLTERQINVFLPLRREVHRWKDRHKPVELPLFAGYLFVQLSADPAPRLRVLRTFGVVRIVSFGQEQVPVPEAQIEMLRRLTASDAPLHRQRYLRAGQRVKVISGTLSGVVGTLVRVKKSDRLVISITPIRQSVAVEISGYDVVPVG